MRIVAPSSSWMRCGKRFGVWALWTWHLGRKCSDAALAGVGVTGGGIYLIWGIIMCVWRWVVFRRYERLFRCWERVVFDLKR